MSHNREPGFIFCAYLQLLLLFFLDPILILVFVICSPTYSSSFLLSHQAFWHCSILTIISFLFVFQPKTSEANPDDLHKIFYFFLMIYLSIFCHADESILKYIKKKVQKMSHIIIGLFGMILSVWMIIGCIVSKEFDFYRTVSFFEKKILKIENKFFIKIDHNVAVLFRKHRDHASQKTGISFRQLDAYICYASVHSHSSILFFQVLKLIITLVFLLQINHSLESNCTLSC